MDIDIDFTDLHRMFSDNNLENANREFTVQAGEQMQPYVPKEFGPLRGSKVVQDYETLVWDGLVYAPIQYYTQFQNYTTPGTGPYWDKVASGNHMTDWEQAYLRGLGL